MESLRFENNFTAIETFRNFSCRTGRCPHAVLKTPTAESIITLVLQLIADFLGPIVVPAILSILSCHLWSHYNTCTRDITCSRPLPPGGYGFPIVGETLHLIFGKNYFIKRRKKYGNIYKTHLLGQPTIRVIGAENVKQILRGENSIVTARWPTSTCILLGEGCLSTASGFSHVNKKRILMKAFTFEALSGYVPVIQEVTRMYIRKWCLDKHVYGFPELKVLNFDLSCRLLTGVQMDQTECRRFMDIFEEFKNNIFCLPVNMPGSGFRKGLQAREKLLQKIEEAIIEKQSDVSNGGTNILSILLDRAGTDSFSKSVVKNTCIELLFAGQETTSCAACFLLLELAKHPEVRKRIQQEMTSVGLNEPVDMNDIDLQLLNKMPYVSNVVKEGLRLCPPIGGGFRKAKKTFEINGFQIPKGWAVTYAIRDTHETGGYYEDPEKFDPNRWNDSSLSENRFQYLPFGGGRRVCAGKDLAQMMLKIFTLELVRCCKWDLVNKDTKFKVFPTPCPTDKMPLVFTPLQDNIWLTNQQNP